MTVHQLVMDSVSLRVKCRVIYIFIHGRPLGSYDITLRQKHI